MELVNQNNLSIFQKDRIYQKKTTAEYVKKKKSYKEGQQFVFVEKEPVV